MTSPRKIAKAKDALGMPVPPIWLMRMATWFRNLLGRLHARMVPGFSLVYERSLGIVDTKALFCAVELELPDLLTDGPRSAAELANAAGANADAVERLLRYLVSRDFFTRLSDGRFANNGATDKLRKAHPYSWRDWVLLMGSDWLGNIFNHMPASVREGRCAAEAAFGMSFFDYVNQKNPQAKIQFNGAMAAGARLQALFFAEAMDLSKYQHVCDIGGGSGSVLAHVLTTNTQLRGTVFDLPELAEQAKEVLSAGDLAERATFVGGDFFESVPAGCDLYTLFAVIHDWGDQDCVRILRNIRKVMAPQGHIMVIEMPIQRGAGFDSAKAVDMLMLTVSQGGRERTDDEYQSLFEKAGLHLRRRIIMPSMFEIFELEKA